MDSPVKVRRKLGKHLAIHKPSMYKDLAREGKDRVYAESKSDSSDKLVHDQPHIRLENTYRLQPDDGKKFVCCKVENKMNEVLESLLENMTYDDVKSNITTELATQIKKEIRQFPWPRYKYVVQVVIGQNSEQAVQIGSRCLWNHRTDTFACATYSNKTIYAVAACFAIYFE